MQEQSVAYFTYKGRTENCFNNSKMENVAGIIFLWISQSIAEKKRLEGQVVVFFFGSLCEVIIWRLLIAWFLETFSFPSLFTRLNFHLEFWESTLCNHNKFQALQMHPTLIDLLFWNRFSLQSKNNVYTFTAC